MLKNLKRFLEPILIEKKYFFQSVFIQIIFSFYTIFNIFFVKKIVEIIEKGQTNELNFYIYIYIIVHIVYFILVFFARHWGWASLFYHHFKMIHRKYLKQFNDLDNTYIENIGTGKSLSIITKGIQTWSELVMDSMQVPVGLLISLISTFIILSSIGYIYIFAFLIIFVLLHIIAYHLNNKILIWRNKRIETINEYDRQLTKMIMSKFEILQNNKIDREIKVLDKYANEATDYNLKTNNFLVVMFSLPDILFFMIFLSIFYYVLNYEFSYNFLISSFMIIGMLRQNLTESIRFFKDFTKKFGQVERFWSLIDNGPEIKGLSEGKDFEYKVGNIEIKNLCFSYGKYNVFENLTTNIIGSKKTAFVGVSGGGKTTLVKLISGFISQNSGDIIVDGQSLSKVNLNSYYKNIGYLTQDPSVFDGTILENLVYGIEKDENEIVGTGLKPVPTENIQEKIKRAIKLASAEFIYDFKDGLNTEIGERGVRLSGGQKQRLAIAKLFIKDPHIIILDEPTSALDSFSEENITASFEKLFAGRTVLIIAHRLQTVKGADDIIVLNKGKIIERGNHEYLIKQNGYYKKMLDLQSGF